MSSGSDDAEVLSSIGIIFEDNFVMIIPELIMYGMYLIIFPYAIFTLLRKPARTVAVYYLLALTTALFSFATMDVVSHIAVNIIEYRGYLVNPQVPLEDRHDYLLEIMAPWLTLEVISGPIVFIFADAIVMWRAYVLYPHSTLLRGLMVAMVLANTILNLSFIIVAGLSVSNFFIEPNTYLDLYISMTFLSFGTNFVATVLIAYRAWKHHAQMKFHGAGRTRVGSVLLLLVETGVFFCVMQFVNSMITAFDLDPTSALDKAANIISVLTGFSAAIFPALLIVIVNRESTSIINSTLELNGSGSQTNQASPKHDGKSERGQPVSTLQFASVHTSHMEGSRSEGDTVIEEDKAEV